MTQAVAETTPAAEPIPCPMCDYDLRGQPEPRCPECGYRFEWPQLLDAELKRHPYLFEHHPRRNIRTFFRTLLGGFLPRRFWRSLRPSQPSAPRRLVLYWLLATLLVLVLPAVDMLRLFRADALEHEARRSRMLAGMKRAISVATGPNLQLLQRELARVGGPQAWVDQRYPPAMSWAFVRAWLVGGENGDFNYLPGQWPTLRRMLHVPLIYASWPWLTLVTLMIFRASMKRAKVKTVHVLRCTLYSCDAGVLLVPLGGLLGGTVAYSFVPALGGIGIDYRMVAALLFAGYTSYRLAAAYALYMRFDRPAATALASQGIVLLFVLIVLSWWPPYTY
jgi:hypothetical protein